MFHLSVFSYQTQFSLQFLSGILYTSSNSILEDYADPFLPDTDCPMLYNEDYAVGFMPPHNQK